MNAEKSAIIHFRRKACAKCDHQFSIGGEAIPVVAKYKCLGCATDEYPDLNAMVDDRAEAGRRALGSLLQGAQSTVGMLYAWLHLYRKLLDSMVQSVFLYGAEAWGCLRGLKLLEQHRPAENSPFLLWCY